MLEKNDTKYAVKNHAAATSIQNWFLAFFQPMTSETPAAFVP